MAQVVWNHPITKVSSTLTDFGNGAATGMTREEVGSDGLLRKYVLLKAAGTITANAVVKKTTGSGVMDVIETAADTDVPVGVNETGADVTTGQYFWGTQGPMFVCLSGAGPATVGEPVSADANGSLIDYTNADAANYRLGVVVVAVSGGLATVWGSCLGY